MTEFYLNSDFCYNENYCKKEMKFPINIGLPNGKSIINAKDGIIVRNGQPMKFSATGNFVMVQKGDVLIYENKATLFISEVLR